MATSFKKIKFECGGNFHIAAGEYDENYSNTFTLNSGDYWNYLIKTTFSGYPACCGWTIMHDLWSNESISVSDIVLFIKSVCKYYKEHRGATGWFQAVTPNNGNEDSNYLLWDQAFEKIGATAIFKFKNPNSKNELTTWAFFIK